MKTCFNRPSCARPQFGEQTGQHFGSTQRPTPPHHLIKLEHLPFLHKKPCVSLLHEPHLSVGWPSLLTRSWSGSLWWNRKCLSSKQSSQRRVAPWLFHYRRWHSTSSLLRDLKRTLCTATLNVWRGTVLSSMSDRLSDSHTWILIKCSRLSAADPRSPEWVQLSFHQECWHLVKYYDYNEVVSSNMFLNCIN